MIGRPHIHQGSDVFADAFGEHARFLELVTLSTQFLALLIHAVFVPARELLVHLDQLLDPLWGELHCRELVEPPTSHHHASEHLDQPGHQREFV